MHLDLILKLIEIIVEPRQRMKIGLLDEINSTGFEQFLKTIKKFREVLLAVFNERSGKTIGYSEFPIVFANQIKE
jgi:hypothetical protein